MKALSRLLLGGLLLAACGDSGSSSGGSSWGGSSSGGSSSGGSSSGGSSSGGSSSGGSSSGGSSSGGSSSGGSSSGGFDPGGADPGGGGAGGGAATCASACAALYACGLETDSNGDPLCPNFDGSPAQAAQFSMTCEAGCAMTPALINLIDSSDCAGTIATISAVSVDFDAICDEPPPPPMGCTLLCGQLYDCGAENGNCPAFSGDPGERDAFIALCVPECTPVEGILASAVDPANCSQTVSTVSGASATFAGYCQNGLP